MLLLRRSRKTRSALINRAFSTRRRGNMKRLGWGVLVAASLAFLVVGGGLHSAQNDEPLVMENAAIKGQAQAETDSGLAGWTAQQLESAKEMALPIPEKDFSELKLLTDDAIKKMGAESKGEPGKGAGNDKPNKKGKVFSGKKLKGTQSDIDETGIAGTDGLFTPQTWGTFGAPCTSSRLLPRSSRYSYPYRAVGKLFFKKGTSNYVCSAAVLRPRIILTAGHCVYDAASRRWNSNFLFIPSYENGSAPYQAWSWRWAVVTGQWAYGGGGVPNRADYAIIELGDRLFGTRVRRIGDVTGYFGWQTYTLARNHTKKIGYPCNHDSCQVMHQVDSANLRSVYPNNVEYGSDMRGGSSGGPWIQNFGRPASGQYGGYNTGLNRIVGVTSYGYISTGPKVQGSSILTNTFVSILNMACAHRSGNC